MSNSTPYTAEHVRRIIAWNRQRHEETLTALCPAEIGSVGIIGAGLMGTSIAAAHALHRLPVVIYDANPAVLGRAQKAVATELTETANWSAAESLAEFVRPAADLAEAARCDLVLETIVESLPAKLNLMSQLRRCLSERTIVASNTSTIPIARLAGGLADPSRFCGIHFCHPVDRRPLVEIARGPQTNDRTAATAVAHALGIDRIPIVVRDGPGFVVNRLLFPYLGAGLKLLQAGVSAEVIDRAATDFGMAVGPLRMMDEIGLDTTLGAAVVLASAFPERVVSSPLLVSLIKAGRLGRKSGAGFFLYGKDGEREGREGDSPIFAARNLGQPPDGCQLVLPMLLEATRILEEAVVGDARDIDLAALLGLGFPADKGGLLYWADTLGARRIVDLLRSLETTDPRMEPTPMLKNMAESGGRFYAATSPAHRREARED